jgi:2-hydroxy-3-oxopropionate reductase
MNKMENIGFIGLGIMGAPMASNLCRAGVIPAVYDLNPDAVARLTALGARSVGTLEMGKECDIVFTILPNGPIVDSVLFGENGVATAMKPGSLVIDMSSVTPDESKSFAEKLSKLGIGFLDAPVSGGEPKAIDGTLAFMVGGNDEDFRRAEPYFRIMGDSWLLVGENGSGSVTKLANQIIVNLTIAAVSEALVLATKAGTDPEKVYQAIRGGLAGSAVLDAKAPMMLARNFVPGGKISINLKDIKNVMASAHNMDVPLPMTAQLLEIMQSLKVGGHLNDDHSGIVQYFEDLAGVQVKAGGDGEAK